MAIRILQSDRVPGPGNFWSNPQPFGGDVITPIISGDGGITSHDAHSFTIDGGSFTGLQAVFQGSFSYPGGDPVGTVDSITFSYNGTVFQTWSNLNWDIATQIEPVITAYDNGDSGAWDNFLAGFNYKFVISHDSSDVWIMGTANRDVITAQIPDTGNGSASVKSFGGNDVIDLHNLTGGTYTESGAGRDKVTGGTGADQIRGGGGNDWLSGGQGSDNIDGQAGNDKIMGGGGSDEYLAGGKGNDTILGGGGSDDIHGGGGDDVAHGGKGNDTIDGGPGHDRLFGDGGRDRITGHGTLNGGAGNDSVEGTGHLSGGSGDDSVTGSGHLNGGSGDDELRGLSAGDSFDFRLHGASSFGNDHVTSYNYELSSDPGSEFFLQGAPHDQLIFDAGVSVDVHYVSAQDVVKLTARESDGGVIGTVEFSMDGGMTDVDMHTSIVTGIQNDLVFI